jgi:hypothetical protein
VASSNDKTVFGSSYYRIGPVDRRRAACSAAASWLLLAAPLRAHAADREPAPRVCAPSLMIAARVCVCVPECVSADAWSDRMCVQKQQVKRKADSFLMAGIPQRAATSPTRVRPDNEQSLERTSCGQQVAVTTGTHRACIRSSACDDLWVRASWWDASEVCASPRVGPWILRCESDRPSCPGAWRP